MASTETIAWEYRRRINRVMDHIHHNLLGDLSLETLAREACFSAFHFHRVFRGMTGETLQDFIRRQRLNAAATRITYERDTPLTEIALDVGFGSLAAFTRAFKDHFGTPPSRWVPPEKGNLDQMLSNSGKASDSEELYSEDTAERRLSMKPIIEKMSEVNYVYWRAIGPYGKEQIQEAWNQAYQWAGPRRLLAGEWQTLGISWDDPHLTPGNKCRYDACVAVPPDTDTGELNRGTIPAGSYAVFSYKGNVAGLSAFFDSIYKAWLPASGWLPGSFPCFERYTPAHAMNQETGEFACDICVPVVPA